MVEEVLVLADGTKIDKKTGEVVKDQPQPVELLNGEGGKVLVEDENADDVDTREEILEIKKRLPVNRHINDLPGDVNSSRAVAVVASLTLFGLSDSEIAYMCNTSVTNVTTIKQAQRYEDFIGAVIDNVMRAQSDNIRAIFINNARDAAEHIVSGMSSRIPEVKMQSATQILDRAGFRPVDIVEHRIRHENELKIVHIKGDDTKGVTIDTDYEVVK